MFDSRPLERPSAVQRNQEKAQLTNLKWILLGIAGLMFLIALVEWLVAPQQDSRAWTAASMGMISLVAYGFTLINRRRVLTVPLVFSIVAMGGWAMCSYGSVRSSASLAMIAAVALAGAFSSRRFVIVVTLTALLVLGGVTWAEVVGILGRESFEAGVRYWSLGGVILLVLGALLYYARLATDEARVRWLNQMEDRTRMEVERDQYERRFARIFRLNPAALMVQIATSRIIVDVNPAFERQFARSRDQLVGKTADFLWSDVQAWQSHLTDLLAHGKSGWITTEGLRADGQRIDVQVNSALSDNQLGAFILTTVVEAT